MGHLGDKRLTVILEAQEVLMVSQSRAALEVIVKPFRRFHNIISTGMETTDPKVENLEVKMPRGLLLPSVVHVNRPEGTFTVCH